MGVKTKTVLIHLRFKKKRKEKVLQVSYSLVSDLRAWAMRQHQRRPSQPAKRWFQICSCFLICNYCWCFQRQRVLDTGFVLRAGCCTGGTVCPVSASLSSFNKLPTTGGNNSSGKRNCFSKPLLISLCALRAPLVEFVISFYAFLCVRFESFLTEEWWCFWTFEGVRANKTKERKKVTSVKW